MGDQPTSLSDEDTEGLNSYVLPELTIKIYGRVDAGGKNYVLRNMMVGNSLSTATFRWFVVHEFGNKVCGEAKDLEIGYFKGNKRVWICMDDEYLRKLRNRKLLRYGVSVVQKPLGENEF